MPRSGPRRGSRGWGYIPLIPGTKFGEWTAISEMPRVGPQRYAYCTCSCGAFKAVNLQTLRNGKSTRCQSCANRDTRNNQYVHGLALRERKTPEYKIWMATRARAKERGLEHTIEPKDVVIPDVCPILGITLKGGEGAGHGFKPELASLDRIDSSRGYVPGNVCVISWKANQLKSDNTLETLERIKSYMQARLS